MTGDKQYNILLIDDDFAVNYLHKIILEDAGFTKQVYDFTSAQEALQFLQQTCRETVPSRKQDEKPDIMFIDINMPEMDGFEFIEQLERTCQEIYQKTVLCILSSSDHSKDKKRANDLGVTCYLSKPLDEEKLQVLLNIMQKQEKS